jgi:hypothetical protein
LCNTAIRQDNAGRYCLNDLHKAAGGKSADRPSMWLKNKQTQGLIAEVAKAGIPALETKRGGNDPATFVVKEVVYAYAMWISPAFHLKVIRAYDAMVTAPANDPRIPKTFSEALRLAAETQAANSSLLCQRLLHS